MSEPLRVLYVAYALTQITPDSCGGTEQVLATLLSEFAQPAYRWLETTTVAAAGSRVPGRLVSTNRGYWSHPLREEIVVHDAAQAIFGERHNAVASAELDRNAYDLVTTKGALGTGGLGARGYRYFLRCICRLLNIRPAFSTLCPKMSICNS